MTGLILARIERIRRGHSDRSLIHAIAGDLEYKLEVHTDEVAGLGTGEGHMLVLSWSIHASPAVTVQAEAASPATPVSVDAQLMSMMHRGTEGTAPTAALPTTSTPVATAGAPTPESVDAQFMTLMNRSKSSAPAPEAATSLSGPERQLASLLGLPTRG